MRMQLRDQALALMLTVVAVMGLTSPVQAQCPHTRVQDISSTCLDQKCPPGVNAYWATIVNRFPATLYVTYAFRPARFNRLIIPGGLELPPKSAIRKPLGIGRSVLPEESHDSRIGRLRILECGTDPKIRYKWRRQ